jgi:hypothetical protein
MAGPDLIDSGRVGLKDHQVGGFTPNPPSGVIGVHDCGGRHRHSHPRVGGANRGRRPPQGVLSQGPLRQPHPGEEVQHCRHLAHGDPHGVVQRMGYGQHARPQAVGGCPSLVRRDLRMLPADLVATHRAPVYPHPVWGHLRMRLRGELGYIDEVDTLLRQRRATARARIERHLHVHGGLGDSLGRRGIPVVEGACPRLPSRPLRLDNPSALRKRGGLPLGTTPESLDLSLQRLDSRGQLRKLALLCSDLLVLLRDQGQQGVLTQVCEVFGAIHGTEYSPPTWRPQAKPLINYIMVMWWGSLEPHSYQYSAEESVTVHHL